ncbi:hypothetical protein [Streptomyces sp. NPDC085937]|uniref:hypothetical protein n=1 Tax=Streptomyces sp. NPDC085937 TaxID=3365742 RepID=UPI0037CE2135
MPWVKLDDRFPSHRKIALLSDRAFRLHVSAICWCAENLTDGRIADRELALVTRVRGVKATAKQLEDAGLWDRTEDGWVIHDYLDYNPSREQVLLERKKNAERQERFRRRKNGKPTPPNDSDRNARSNGVTRDDETQNSDTTEARRRHDGDTTATRSSAVQNEEAQASEVRNGVTNDAPTRPDPNPISMADVDGESDGSSAAERDAFGALSPIDSDGWALGDGLRRWVLNTFGAGIDADYEAAQFLSHFRSTGQTRRNWNDEFQKWVRRSAKFASERAARPSNVIALPNGQQLTGTDAKVAGWMAIAEQLRQEGDLA